MSYFEKLYKAQYSYPLLIFRDYLLFSGIIGIGFIIPLCRYIMIPSQIPATIMAMYQLVISYSMWMRANTKTSLYKVIIRLILIPIIVVQIAIFLSLLSYMITHPYEQWNSATTIRPITS